MPVLYKIQDNQIFAREKQGICYVVGAGNFTDRDIHPLEDDYVIAADGGYTYLSRIGIHPDLLLGDWDSIADLPDHENMMSFQSEKDDTDMMLALKEGLKRGYRCFRIYGGTGGSFDHTYANIQALAYLSGKGAQGYLIEENRTTTIISNNEIHFGAEMKGYISVFAYSNQAVGVNEFGLKYTLTDKLMTNDDPIGVRNEFIGRQSCISVSEGTIMITWDEECNV